ncbi:urease accessory protein UreH domain-containing protein [Gemmatimonas sp.]
MSLLLLATAFALGAAHAVAPDHLAAVGVFVSRARSTREAFTHGAHWGLGHALTLTLAGLAVLFVAREWPALLSVRAEWLVGVVLVVLGLRTIWQVRRGVGVSVANDVSAGMAHRHADGTVHQHRHTHRHPLLGIGMLHGLAGSGAMTAIVPVSAGQDPWQAALWMALFGVGTVAAMAVIAGAAGWSLRFSAQRSARAMRGIVMAAGLASVAVGIFWLLETSVS